MMIAWRLPCHWCVCVCGKAGHKAASREQGDWEPNGNDFPFVCPPLFFIGFISLIFPAFSPNLRDKAGRWALDFGVFWPEPSGPYIRFGRRSRVLPSFVLPKFASYVLFFR